MLRFSEPTRPVMRYLGGKWRLAPWVIRHFPPHARYVEPFGGGASVLMRKRRAPCGEVYNDRDGDVVNVFRVLRDADLARRLAESIRLTPFARDEFNAAWPAAAGEDELAPTDAVERARRLLVRAGMGFNSGSATLAKNPGFCSRMDSHGVIKSESWGDWWRQVAAFTERLSGVLVENDDALLVMSRFDAPDTLHYCDPPYTSGTNTYRCTYDEADHAHLCDYLRTLSGCVILSGYDNDVYKHRLSGWTIVRKDSLCFANKTNTECLWLSPRTVAALNRPTQPMLSGMMQG